jgi:pimeloyl-ACP methyl ester carboxylesterase
MAGRDGAAGRGSRVKDSFADARPPPMRPAAAASEAPARHGMTAPAPRSDAGWSTIVVDGHACELYEPADPPPGRAVIYLHGVRERTLRESAGLREAIEAARLPAVAPRAGRSWWLDRIVPAFDPSITPERFVLGPTLAEIRRRFGVAPPGVAVVGTSMGGQGALRLAYRHPATFPVAAAIAPAIDFHAAMREIDTAPDGGLFDTLWEIFAEVERARQDTAILHVHPLNWPRHQWFASDPSDVRWHDGAVRLAGKLRALGIPHVARLESRGPFPAGATGHSAAYYDRVAPEAIRFVLESLDAEARRLA